MVGDSASAAARLHVGVVATSTIHGGAELNIEQIWTSPIVSAVATGHLLGALPQWAATGLPATDLELGAKWSYRRAVRSIASMPAVVHRSRRTVRELHRSDPFDTFYAHFKREQVLLTSSLARLAPVVWMEHGHLPVGRFRRPLLVAYRRASRHVSAITCLSESVRTELIEVLADGAPDPVVIPNAIDAAWATPATDQERRSAREALGVDPDAALVVSAVGQLIPRKRVELAIDAAATSGSWVVVCGDGPLAPDLRLRAAGNPRVVFTGFLRDPRQVYAAADVNLLASDEEGFGQVLLEGACAGLPAVVVADGGFPERVDGWGAVAAAPTGQAVATAIEAAALMSRSEPRRWAEAHDLGRWGRAHLELLTRVVGRQAV